MYAGSLGKGVCVDFHPVGPEEALFLCFDFALTVDDFQGS